jgi:hypothetical protein
MPHGTPVRRSRLAPRVVCFALLATLLSATPAAALIEGGQGNDPINNPRWPAGAAAVFDDPARLAYWVGPPFGGGQWHGEFRGDVAVFNATLAQFAKIEVKVKRLVVRDGVGRSFWLNTNDEPEKRDAAQMDWRFIVWEPESWKFQQGLPAGLQPREVVGDEAPAIIEAYAGGNLEWDEVVVPEGVEIDDQRLEARGFAVADGPVLEGRVTGLDTHQPLAAHIVLASFASRPTGGYEYTTEQEAETDADGHWVMKKVPPGRYRISASADGYVPRIAGYVSPSNEPAWHEFTCSLGRPGPISGVVADESGQPLADVAVAIRDVVASDGREYESPDEFSAKTDAEGRFRIDQIPAGTGRVSLHKDGYVVPGLGRETQLPAGVALMMSRSSQLRVTVNFRNVKRDGEYVVMIEPEGGNKVGSWGGSGNINDDNLIEFKNVPSGRYVLTGRPNPGAERETTKPVTVDLRGGEDVDVTLDAIVR